MLQLDANITLNESYVLFITLVKITYQSRDQYPPSMHSWDSSPWQGLYILLLFFFFSPDRSLKLFVCGVCILQMRNKPNQFLIPIKSCFFSNP